ncbi:HD-GYP domain-containing protein [Psychrilyobacter sp.]|uniref:HD-GYP domain-containing protein n=1 Tax=Psychrilyobacter sp. TaxID=2586924 RepID=UPI00301A07A7
MNYEYKNLIKIVMYYMLFGIFWIFYSAKFLHLMTRDLSTYIVLEHYKSYLYIFLTTALLFKMIRSGYLKMEKSNRKFQQGIVQSFIAALEFHDEYTKGHSEAVASYSLEIGKALGLKGSDLDDLYWAATMHDIGKIIVPIEILNKSEKLTDKEYEIIKEHSKTGYEIVSKNESLKKVSKYILYHHERWDGIGYPEGLKGEEIPLLSQIISVADSWHAMTSKRSYKDQLTCQEAIEELVKNKGTQFAPQIVTTFIKVYNLRKDLFLFEK